MAGGLGHRVLLLLLSSKLFAQSLLEVPKEVHHNLVLMLLIELHLALEKVVHDFVAVLLRQ